MSEFENSGEVRLCGKQREFYHVEYMWSGKGQILLFIALLYIWSGKTEVKFWYLQGYITLDR